jgi:hypothetical protein
MRSPLELCISCVSKDVKEILDLYPLNGSDAEITAVSGLEM